MVGSEDKNEMGVVVYKIKEIRGGKGHEDFHFHVLGDFHFSRLNFKTDSLHGNES